MPTVDGSAWAPVSTIAFFNRSLVTAGPFDWGWLTNCSKSSGYQPIHGTSGYTEF
jgi:hypothetical protein